MNTITRNDRIREVWMQVKDRQQIAKLMVIQGISQREMSRIIGWESHSYLGRILNGTIKSINSDAAARIAATLGVGVDDLFLARVSTTKVQSAPRKGAA